MSRRDEQPQRDAITRPALTPWRCSCGSRAVLDGDFLRCPSTCDAAAVHLGPLAPYLALQLTVKP